MKKPFDPSTLRDEVTDPNLTPGRFGAPIDVRAPNVDPEKVVADAPQRQNPRRDQRRWR